MLRPYVPLLNHCANCHRAALKAPIREDVELPKGVVALDTPLKPFEPPHESTAATSAEAIELFKTNIKKGTQ